MLVGVVFIKNEPWSVSIVAIHIGSRSSGLVQCWEKISSCYIDRLTAVAATVTITAAATVLITATVTVTGTAPCSYCFRRSFSFSSRYS